MAGCDSLPEDDEDACVTDCMQTYGMMDMGYSMFVQCMLDECAQSCVMAGSEW